jgi:hypothetical protein
MTNAPARMADGAIGSYHDCPELSSDPGNRMKILRATLVAVAAIAVLPAGLARAEVLECTMDPGFGDVYVAPKIRIEYDAFRTARISDSVIATTGLPDIEGTVERETDALIRFFWVVKAVRVHPLDDSLSYRRNLDLVSRLTVQFDDGAAVLSQSNTSGYLGRTARVTGQCRNVD